MKIDGYIKRYSLRGRAVTKVRALAKTNMSAAIDYCKGKRTLPQAVREEIETNNFVDQIVVHKEFPSEALSAKDIYFMAFPTRAIEYMHCTAQRRIVLGVLAQRWTNDRIESQSGTCKCHFVATTKRPRCLRFVKFGGTMTKTGHTKVFSWDSVKAQFAAEGIPLR